MRDEEQSPADDAGAPAPKQSIGETLRATREFRRASIEHVSELLRIEPRFIVALEEDRFAAIGPPVFVKGYLKHYAELLGVDPRPLLEELRERLGREEPPLQARRSAEQVRERSSHAAVVIGVAALALALAAVAVWQLGGRGSGSERAEPAAAAAGAPSPASAESADVALERPALPSGSARPATGGAASSLRRDGIDGAVAPAGPGDRASAESSAVAPAADAPIALEASAVGRPASVLGGADSGAEADAPQTVRLPAAAVVAAPAPAEATAEERPAGASGLEIGLRFVEDSWTEVTSAAGERLFYGLGRAGLEERIRADDEVRVLLGNADGVVVSVNGEPFAYPAGSRSGDLARFRLSPDN